MLTPYAEAALRQRIWQACLATLTPAERYRRMLADRSRAGSISAESDAKTSVIALDTGLRHWTFGTEKML